MFERFTLGARAAVIAAQAEARTLGHERIGPEHLLLGVCRDGGGLAASALADAGCSIAACRSAVAELGRRPTRAGLSPADVEALAWLGIDVEAVERRLVEEFGPLALTGPAPRGRRRHPLRRRRFARAARAARSSRRAAVWRSARAPGRWRGHLPFDRDAKAVLEASLREALSLRSREIGAEHVLLALVSGRAPGAEAALRRVGVDPFAVRRSLLHRMGEAA